MPRVYWAIGDLTGFYDGRNRLKLYDSEGNGKGMEYQLALMADHYGKYLQLSRIRRPDP